MHVVQVADNPRSADVNVLDSMEVAASGNLDTSSNADQYSALAEAHFQLDATNIHALGSVLENWSNTCNSKLHLHPANREIQLIRRRTGEQTEILHEIE
jgi:hypothetical protein